MKPKNRILETDHIRITIIPCILSISAFLKYIGTKLYNTNHGKRLPRSWIMQIQYNFNSDMTYKDPGGHTHKVIKSR